MYALQCHARQLVPREGSLLASKDRLVNDDHEEIAKRSTLLLLGVHERRFPTQPQSLALHRVWQPDRPPALLFAVVLMNSGATIADDCAQAVSLPLGKEGC